ncbi:hypothetical protein GGI35DRAFT_27244 [Trichoderma velutinum]
MKISISESIKGPSCTMAAFLITLSFLPSIHPSSFHLYIHPNTHPNTHPIPSLSVPISTQFPPLSRSITQTNIPTSFHLFIPPNSQPILLPNLIPASSIPIPPVHPSIHPFIPTRPSNRSNPIRLFLCAMVIPPPRRRALKTFFFFWRGRIS